MATCYHKWSTIKRWSSAGKYNVIQRCRRCETWIKREIDYKELSQSKPSMTTNRIEERIKQPTEDHGKFEENDLRKQSVAPSNSPVNPENSDGKS